MTRPTDPTRTPPNATTGPGRTPEHPLGLVLDLLGRVSEATEGSRELDLALAQALGENWSYRGEPPTEIRCGRFTTSLDASLALCSRVLPGWTIAHIGQDDHKLWHVELREGFATSYNRVALSTLGLKGSPSPALALIAAMMKAVIAKGSE